MIRNIIIPTVIPQMMPTVVGVSGPRPVMAMMMVGGERKISQLWETKEISGRVA